MPKPQSKPRPKPRTKSRTGSQKSQNSPDEPQEKSPENLQEKSSPQPMNRSDLVRLLAKHNTRLDEEILNRYVDVVFESIADALAEGRRVEIRGFGSFWTKERRERMSRNPRTGESVFVPQKRVPAFRAGRLLRERLVESATNPNPTESTESTESTDPTESTESTESTNPKNPKNKT